MLKQLGLLLGLGLVLLSSNTQANRNVELEQESQTFSSGNKVAVVVGINKYSRLSGLKNLKYARSDAQIINSVLDKRHGYETTPLLGSDANKNHILAAIQNAGSRLRGKNGTLIFFFAGHGFSKGNRNYLATSDFAMNRVAQSALSVHELEQAIQRTGARRAIIFIDACREDPWIDGARNFAQDSFRVRHSKGVQYLFGSEFGKQSWETDKLKHGVFSYFLYRGLNGAAVEPNGLISFDSLAGYVQEEVGKWSHQNLPVTQTPFSEGKAYGVFVLGDIDAKNNNSSQVLAESSNIAKNKELPTVKEKDNSKANILPKKPQDETREQSNNDILWEILGEFIPNAAPNLNNTEPRSTHQAIPSSSYRDIISHGNQSIHHTGQVMRNVELTGSGNIRISGNVMRNVELKGSGNIHIHGNVMRNVELKGSGNIHIYGNVMRNIIISGSGNVYVDGSIYRDIVIYKNGGIKYRGQLHGQIIEKRR